MTPAPAMSGVLGPDGFSGWSRKSPTPPLRSSAAAAAGTASRPAMTQTTGVNGRMRARHMVQEVGHEGPSDARTFVPTEAHHIESRAMGGNAAVASVHGRADELRALRALLDQASRGNLRCAFIQGDAGMGKTRLVSEMLAVAE